MMKKEVFSKSLQKSVKSAAVILVAMLISGAANAQTNVPAFEMIRVEGSGDIKSFSIGKFEVTQGLWNAVMGSNPSNTKGGDNYPVEMINWYDAREFVSKLNTLTGKSYRLPTEAEWEYAARGGNKSKGYTYSGSNDMSEVGWYSENSGGKLQPVGTKKPNELGIYDMSGNVCEWCIDETGGSLRAIRGGAWDMRVAACTVAVQDYYTVGGADINIGFRLVE